MNFYGLFDAEGLPTAFFNEEIHGDDGIPDGAVPLTEGEWGEFIENHGRRRWDAATAAIVPYEPPPAPPSVPALVSRAQAKMALLQAGFMPAAKAAIAEDTTGRLEILFNDTSNWYRDNAAIAEIGAKLGMSSDDMDQLFVLAETIPL